MHVISIMAQLIFDVNEQIEENESQEERNKKKNVTEEWNFGF